MAKKDSVAMLEAKIEVLKRAKKKFKTGCFPGLCSAIYHSWNYEEPHLCNAARKLTRYITVELKGHTYLRSWLWGNRPNLDTSETHMKRYRLKWIDWMIACLQEDLQYKQAKQRKKG